MQPTGVKSRRGRWKWGACGVAFLGFLGANVLAFVHARALTRFVPADPFAYGARFSTLAGAGEAGARSSARL